ncbi:MAG: hypothetical protein OXN92_08880 [Gammaproteobacteria bacterium]|nr:hypothetical protein [Gammaproteobacteria bacterium]
MRDQDFLTIAHRWILALACLVVPAASAAAQEPEEEDLVPAGFGTLLQDEVSLSLRSQDLLIKATPLAEEVTRLTAPDTHARLSALAAAHRETLEFQTRSTDPVLFLVSVFSYQPDVTYQPEDINIVNQGIRERPLAIQAITPGWGVQRLDQQETQMAIYAFSPFINLDLDLEIEYRDARNAGWQRILTVLEAERAKVRARAGGW